MSTIDLDTKLQEIESRLSATTPGTWRWVGYNLEHPACHWELLRAAGELEAALPGSHAPPTVVLGVNPVEITPNTYHWIVPNRLDDLSFIEHAKEDVGFLLHELRVARRQLAERAASGT